MLFEAYQLGDEYQRGRVDFTPIAARIMRIGSNSGRSRYLPAIVDKRRASQVDSSAIMNAESRYFSAPNGQPEMAAMMMPLHARRGWPANAKVLAPGAILLSYRIAEAHDDGGHRQ